MAAACVTYLGPLPASLRDDLTRQWSASLTDLAVRHNPDFTLHDMVHATMFRENIMPSTILLEGLEKDNLAMVSLVRFVVISTSSTTGGDTTAKA